MASEERHGEVFGGGGARSQSLGGGVGIPMYPSMVTVFAKLRDEGRARLFSEPLSCRLSCSGSRGKNFS